MDSKTKFSMMHIAAVIVMLCLGMASEGKPFFESSLIEPPDKLHNHGSCIVELPNGDFLASWYKGSGERKADDVRIVGARLRRGARGWSAIFEMADFKGFPDCNAAMAVDKSGKLWLFWPLIIANRWETSLLMARSTTHYRLPGAPSWQWQTPILFDPGDRFAEEIIAAVEQFKATLPEAALGEVSKELDRVKEDAKDTYARRMGWMPRSKPTVLPGGRFLLPLYSDRFSFGLVAISDDNGENWTPSGPIISAGGVQPSIVWKKDGTLVAYLRDNGPAPKRILRSESTDNGMTWSLSVDTELPDPGAGVEALRLRNGNWLMVNNDTEEGRHSLAARLSDDEGASWKWIRHLELWEVDKGSASYPSFIQGSDGSIHGTYSCKTEEQGGETIKHVHFNEEWVQAGDQ
ncbi:MAG: neuraminidase (sialidase)-like protein [Candidatus Omnitrophica bacterium COP1]|nr:neuraminidase (sialidase)-like protein [Candidatus Omnitrophica bacterium COP1]